MDRLLGGNGANEFGHGEPPAAPLPTDAIPRGSASVGRGAVGGFPCPNSFAPLPPQ